MDKTIRIRALQPLSFDDGILPTGEERVVQFSEERIARGLALKLYEVVKDDVRAPAAPAKKES